MNLPRLMPAWQAARIDSLELQSPGGGDRPHDAGRGSRILLSFRPVPLSPIRLRWLALIDDYVVDHHFCDMQVTGPFGYWRHCHLVKAEARGGENGTRVTDVVDYEWPVRPAQRLRWIFSEDGYRSGSSSDIASASSCACCAKRSLLSPESDLGKVIRLTKCYAPLYRPHIGVSRLNRYGLAT